MKIVYGYNPVTLEYTGETVADESPLEPGVYLYPAHTTQIVPPAPVEGNMRVFIDGSWNYKLIDGDSEPTPDPQDVPAPVVIVYPVDLWYRLTDEEAEQVESAMSTQSIRVQNIFKFASSYRSDNEFWTLLNEFAIQLFGEERAGEILAPSEH